MYLLTLSIKFEESELIVNYFHQATPEHLEALGVDPTRRLPRKKWLDLYKYEYGLPIEERVAFLVIWELDSKSLGFSTADKIIFGKEAYMHLHILNPENRQGGFGVECVKETAKIYFRTLKLKSIFCEPNAFNVAPNRTLQSAGFKYIKTHKTVPNRLNYHQPVNRWLLEKSCVQSSDAQCA